MANSAHFREKVRNNGLALVLALLFLLSVLGQIACGFAAYNEERSQWGKAAVNLATYLHSGHFVEALFENWESEFLQMGLFVWLSAQLVQKGSAESKPLDEPSSADEDPRTGPVTPETPGPVRRGGWFLWVYERSLGFAFGALFLLAFALHAFGGLRLENEERLAHFLPAQSLGEFLCSSEFWFQSFQNWQSEFLAILSIVVFTIFLRQRGSPQSKPVAAPHSETGH